MSFLSLARDISKCNVCKRLRKHSETCKGKNTKYMYDDYWAKPVPGFGDKNGQLLIVGLAPSAHGANRTGRPFTGDFAGDKLFQFLHRFGFTNNVRSVNRFDALKLKDVYLTNVVRCSPPKDSPKPQEISVCKKFLKYEIELLKAIKVILVIGEVSFDNIKRILREKGANTIGLKFVHGAIYDNLGPNFPTLVVSFHTSQRNFNNGKMLDCQ